MARKSTHVSNYEKVNRNEMRTTTELHSHHNGGSLRKETAEHTLRCLLGCPDNAEALGYKALSLQELKRYKDARMNYDLALKTLITSIILGCFCKSHKTQCR